MRGAFRLVHAGIPGAAMSTGMAAVRPVLLIGGPTASGKSGLALALARRLDGTVINADSMQLYAELRVLTARPGPAEEAEAPHRLYGVVPAAEAMSAARWRALALAEIAAAHAAGRLPILVGGTGLYFAALTRGLADIPPVEAAVRQAARERHARLGGPAFHAELAARDPDSGARLQPGDTQRLLRAWEVLEATGRPLSHWQGAGRIGPPPELAFLSLVVDPPRPLLYAACDCRFAQMLRQGALDEVRALAALGLDAGLPAMKALGVPELRDHLSGRLGLAEATERVQQMTRNYAKRQVTWFRHQMPEAPRFDPFAGGGEDIAQLSERLAGEICTIIRKEG
jgi:tRNA dimethylallyltransferase